MRFHFAGINGVKMASLFDGEDVLVSYADIRKSPGFWAVLKAMILAGRFGSVILDSGAFTELKVKVKARLAVAAGTMTQAAADEMVAKAKIRLADYAQFAAENQDLFAWVANLDDIEGDVARSNANFEALVAAGVRNAAPVFHEGEDDAQLARCVAWAKAGAGVLAVGCQRPKGNLVPKNVVRFLDGFFPRLRAAGGADLFLHGFGLTRYGKAETCPCGGAGYAFDSVDSTTWIAEACAVERSGAAGSASDKAGRIMTRRVGFLATLASYRVAFGGGGVTVPAGFNAAVALASREGQAKTVARRLAAAA